MAQVSISATNVSHASNSAPATMTTLQCRPRAPPISSVMQQPRATRLSSSQASHSCMRPSSRNGLMSAGVLSDRPASSALAIHGSIRGHALPIRRTSIRRACICLLTPRYGDHAARCGGIRFNYIPSSTGCAADQSTTYPFGIVDACSLIRDLISACPREGRVRCDVRHGREDTIADKINRNSSRVAVGRLSVDRITAFQVVGCKCYHSSEVEAVSNRTTGDNCACRASWPPFIHPRRDPGRPMADVDLIPRRGIFSRCAHATDCHCCREVLVVDTVRVASSNKNDNLSRRVHVAKRPIAARQVIERA